MARRAVRVRPAVDSDVAPITLLWQETRDSPDLAVRAVARSEHAADRFAALVDSPEVTVLVATGDDDQVVGFVVLSDDTIGPFVPGDVLRISQFLVRSDLRRHGVGSALLLACAERAAATGVDHLLVEAPPGDRDVNRYFARLGFAAIVVRRQAAVPALIRRLTPTAAEPNRRRAALSLKRTRARSPAPVLLTGADDPADS